MDKRMDGRVNTRSRDRSSQLTYRDSEERIDRGAENMKQTKQGERAKQSKEENTRYDLSILLTLHILVFAHLAIREKIKQNNRHHAKMFRYAFNHSEFIIRRRKTRKGLPSQGRPSI